MTCDARAALALSWEPGDDGELVALDFDRDLVAVVEPSGRWRVESPSDTLAEGQAGTVGEAQAAAEMVVARAAAPVAEAGDLEDDAPPAREPPPVSVRVRPQEVEREAADDETQARLDAAWCAAMAQADDGDRVGAMLTLIGAGWWAVEDHRLVRRWERVRGGRVLSTRTVHSARTLRVDHDGGSWSVSIPLVIWTHEHGPLPAGWQIVHLDGDRSNCHPDNLVAEPLALSRYAAPAREAGQGRLFPRQPQDLARVRERQTPAVEVPQVKLIGVQLTLLEVEAPRCSMSAAAGQGTVTADAPEDPMSDCAAPTMTTTVRALMALHSIEPEALADLLALEPETLTLALDEGWVDRAAAMGAEWLARELKDGGPLPLHLADAVDDLTDDEFGAITPQLIGQAFHELAMRRLLAWVADDRARVRGGEPGQPDAGEEAMALAKAAAEMMGVGA